MTELGICPERASGAEMLYFAEAGGGGVMVWEDCVTGGLLTPLLDGTAVELADAGGELGGVEGAGAAAAGELSGAVDGEGAAVAGGGVAWGAAGVRMAGARAGLTGEGAAMFVGRPVVSLRSQTNNIACGAGGSGSLSDSDCSCP